MAQIKGHLSEPPEGDNEADNSMARLRRAHANLECQVEQLTASLADAASKKAGAEQRLRQYQQVRGLLWTAPPCLPMMHAEGHFQGNWGCTCMHELPVCLASRPSPPPSQGVRTLDCALVQQCYAQPEKQHTEARQQDRRDVTEALW